MKQTITSLFIVFFGITCGYHKTFAQSPAKTVSEFTAFLEHFEQIFPGDTLTDITQSLFITDPWYSDRISCPMDDRIVSYTAPLPPFFKTCPTIRIKCEEGWYVILIHQFAIDSRDLKYADIIYYSDEGNIVDRILLPFVDGMTYSKRMDMGQIYVGEEQIEHIYYEDVFNNQKTHTIYTKYMISRDGFEKKQYYRQGKTSQDNKNDNQDNTK